MSEQSPVAGWYRDTHGVIRWWDGSAWTAHVAPEPAPSAPAALSTRAAAEPVPAMTARAFLPEGVPAHVGGSSATGASTVAPARHRSAAVLDSYGVAPSPVYARRPPERDVGRGLLYIVLGLICLGGCAGTYALAMANGGFVWTGGAIVGVVMIVRGIAAMATPGSSSHQKLVKAADTAADPWTAHHAARRAAATGPRSKQHVSGWVVLACALGVVGVVFAIIAWPTVSSVSTASPPSTGAVVAARPKAVVSPKPTTTAAARKTAVVRDTGPWVPRDRKHDWTSVGVAFAYAELSTSSADCSPGTSCVRILVASKHACSALRLRARFTLLSDQTVGTSTTVLRHVRAGKPVAVRVSVAGQALSGQVTSMRCV